MLCTRNALAMRPNLYTPERIAGPLLNPATEDAADVTKALAGATDAANIWIVLSLIVHTHTGTRGTNATKKSRRVFSPEKKGGGVP